MEDEEKTIDEFLKERKSKKYWIRNDIKLVTLVYKINQKWYKYSGWKKSSGNKNQGSTNKDIKIT